MIYKFNNIEDYSAAISKQQEESAVSLIATDNSLKYDGVNVSTDDPKIGDIACFDENGDTHFIACDTYRPWNATLKKGFPQNWTIVGVVTKRRGNKAVIVHKTTISYKWADVYRWSVEGYEAITDPATELTVTIQGTNIGKISGLDGTKETFISAFNTLAAKAVTDELTTVVASMYYDAKVDKVYLIWNNYNANTTTWTITSITLTAQVGTEIPANSQIERNNGLKTYYAGLNYPRMYEYYSVNGTADPGQAISTIDDTIYSKAAFEAQANYEAPNLYTMYDGDYDAYLNGHMVKYPTEIGIMGPQYRDGRKNTYALAYVTYQDNEGTEKPMYPGAYQCAQLGATTYAISKDFSKDHWWMMSCRDALDVFQEITYGLAGTTRATADPINRSLNAIGGNYITCNGGQWNGNIRNISSNRGGINGFHLLLYSDRLDPRFGIYALYFFYYSDKYSADRRIYPITIVTISNE